MVHGIMRVLLITPPASSADSSSACVVDASQWIGLAAALRGAGLPVEVFDAAALGRDLESVEAHVEHFWPQVVVTRAGGISSAGARAVLRVAKTAVPGVITVMGGERADERADDDSPERVADFDVRGGGEQAEIDLLIRLRDGDEAPGPTRRRRLRGLAAAWSLIGGGR